MAADPHHVPERDHDDGAGPGRRSLGDTPRWVKVFGVAVVVLVLVFVVVLLLGGHSPGRHVPSGGSGRTTVLLHAAAGHVVSDDQFLLGAGYR